MFTRIMSLIFFFSFTKMQGGNKLRWNWLNEENFVWFWWKWRRKIVSWCLEEIIVNWCWKEKIVRRRKYCQLMFGSFLVPSSTVVADESQERTKTSLTNLLESPKETTWCQDDKNTTEPGAALDIFVLGAYGWKNWHNFYEFCNFTTSNLIPASYHYSQVKAWPLSQPFQNTMDF